MTWGNAAPAPPSLQLSRRHERIGHSLRKKPLCAGLALQADVRHQIHFAARVRYACLLACLF